MTLKVLFMLVASIELLSAQPAAMQAKAAGVEAAQRGNYSEAAKQFGEACRIAPALKDVCYYQGRALYYANRFQEAIAPLEKSIAAGESAARAHSTMAQCYEALAESEKAEQFHRKAIAEDANPDYKVRYAQFLFRQGRAQEAIEPLTAALKAAPNDFAANLAMGRVLFEQNQLEKALAFLKKALAAKPKDAQAHLLTAKVCQRLGHKAEAEQHLKAAQVLEP